MSESRADRTSYLGLLALMVLSADQQGWSFPYWNQRQIDAALYALAQATRDGTVRLAAPAFAPTVAISATPGVIPGDVDLEICQTFVDAYGRETDASAVAAITTPAGITDPNTAAILGTPTLGGTSGYDGGLLEVWYSWIDAQNGETLPAPVAQVEVPYQSGGLKSEVLVTLPSTPAAAGAAGANIYVRHRGGNIVLAYRILVASADHCTLTGAVSDCYRSTPNYNSTGSVNAVDITGIAPGVGGDIPAFTRFYIREAGGTWTAGDRRLELSGASEWDPATVVYPLVYTGATAELVPGFPPTVSQVKAIRPLDLSTEAIGTLPVGLLPAMATLETELAKTSGEAVLSGLVVSAQGTPDMTVHVATGEAMLAAGRFLPTAVDRTIPPADLNNPRIDIICLADDGAIEGPTEDAALKGTPGVTPAVPATPAGYLKLAEILVDASVTTIIAEKITDSRWLIPTLRAAVLEFRAADTDIAGDLSTHAADAAAHASKAGTITPVETSCLGSTYVDFTITAPGPMLITEVTCDVTSAGVTDYRLELFSNGSRTVLEYQAGGDSGSGIDAAAFVDRIPLEWFGGATMYGKLTNHSADALTAIAVGVKYRL